MRRSVGPDPRKGRWCPLGGREIAKVLAAVAGVNAFFLALTLTMPAGPGVVAARVRAAFAAGDLGTADYLAFDASRGWHQYNDCAVLQMLAVSGASRLERGLAPRLITSDGTVGQCTLLHSLVSGGGGGGAPPAPPYARYWHGYNVVTAWALQWFELRELRAGLTAAVWASVAVLLLASLGSGPRTRRCAGAIALTAASLWAVPYFAPGLTHGPGDAMLLLVLAGLAARPGIAREPVAVATYAAVFGSVVVFFEMLTGQLPVALAWAVALTLAAGRDEKPSSLRHAPAAASVAAVAFVAGAALTVLIKQALAVALVGPAAASRFLSHLGLYMSPTDFEPAWPALLEPFGRLVMKSHVLTFGNEPAAFGLLAATGVAWAAAASRAWRQRHRSGGRDRVVLLGAALVPAVWTLALPAHTYVHAAFMARMLVVPVALAPLAWLWPAADDCREDEPLLARGMRTAP